MVKLEEKTPPAAVWFLYSEENEPLGQIYRGRKEAVPAIGARLTNSGKWETAEVVDFSELAATCEMRRFQVIVRVHVS